MSVKRLVFQAARWSGALACARAFTRHRFRILTYHGVDPLRDPYLNFDGLQVEPERFEAQLAVLAKACRVVPLRDLVQALAEGRDPGLRAAAITFDDGYQNNLEIAAPILRRMGLPATFFITTGYMDGAAQPWWYVFRAMLRDTRVAMLQDPLQPERVHRVTTPAERIAAIRDLEPRLVQLPRDAREAALADVSGRSGCPPPKSAYPAMNAEGVRSLKALGFDIGNHTHLHRSLRHEDSAVAVDDVRQAQERLSALGVEPVPVLAYPYGLLPDDMHRFARELGSAGLVAGCTTHFGLNAPDTPLFELRRLDITGARDPLNMQALLSGFTTGIEAIRKPGEVG